MESYEIIDLSAHGPNRGLLVAVESIHPLQPAPPLHHHVTAVVREPSDRVMDHVFCALRFDRWYGMPALVQITGHSKQSVRAAIRRLVARKFAEGRPVPEVNAFRQTRMEWRRTR